MIAPVIHRLLCRDDLARLVAEISRTDPLEAGPAARALERGDVHGLLDSCAALDAVRGNGGPPAPLPLALLWYVPLRATLRARGLPDVELADYTATLPVVFTSSRVTRRVTNGHGGLATWWSSIEAMPSGTVAQGEQAADCAALALWWAGCFPEAVGRRGGSGMVRAYVTFAAHALTLASGILLRWAPDAADVFARAAKTTDVLWEALSSVRQDYLGADAHSSEGRLERFLARL